MCPPRVEWWERLGGLRERELQTGQWPAGSVLPRGGGSNRKVLVGRNSPRQADTPSRHGVTNPLVKIYISRQRLRELYREKFDHFDCQCHSSPERSTFSFSNALGKHNRESTKAVNAEFVQERRGAMLALQSADDFRLSGRFLTALTLQYQVPRPDEFRLTFKNS
ncbi:hypothetical protein BDN67DRAFT_1035467 [Paxillus ammoniavirescens]|nr:hypothetical protein BDN67DRAFT_1035467 [Paxillus ammoniavirescens]